MAVTKWNDMNRWDVVFGTTVIDGGDSSGERARHHLIKAYDDLCPLWAITCGTVWIAYERDKRAVRGNLSRLISSMLQCDIKGYALGLTFSPLHWRQKYTFNAFQW